MIQLFTIGHSNRSFKDFLSLLREFGVCVIADIRRYPGSRKFPHFNREILRKLLDAEGIWYVWLEALGGRRHTGKNDKSPPIVSASRKRSSGGRRHGHLSLIESPPNARGKIKTPDLIRGES